MFRQLLKVRYIAVVITALAVLHAVAFLVLGTKAAVHAYKQVLGLSSVAAGTPRPGLELLHSLDFLFVSMVFLVLALGIAKLFLLGPSPEADAGLPSWLRIESISELKVLLWETILVTMLIIALSDITAGLDAATRDWTVLLTPAAIFLLALSLYCMKKE